MQADVRAAGLPGAAIVSAGSRLPALDRAARAVVFAILARLTRAALFVVDGEERFVFGADGAALAATVTVRDSKTYRDVLLGGSVAAGEAYVDGLWTCDDLPSLTRILARNVDVLDALDGGAARAIRRAHGLLTHALRRNTREGSRRNIAAHYDLSPEFFALFLDRSMTYSSAYFERDDASLDEAQTRKIERVLEKLDPGPTDHLLEIGAGWGALAIHAARTRGCRVTTTTISREQHAVATARVREAGLDGRVKVLLRDYRDLTGTFDKLVSVEMIEAVGASFLDGFFRACSARLAPHGLMVLQAITIADQHCARHERSVDFIKEHIFPGSSIPSLTTLTASTTRATDLRLVDLEDMTADYARTLSLWRERFLGREVDVERLGFDERFRRTWEYYLAYCEGGFAERYLGCVQAVFAKPGCQAPRSRRS